MKTTWLLVTLLTASSACAHGFLSIITINDKTYTGNNPFGANDASVIRKVSAPDPNYGTSNRALTCGPSALAASQVADANPGDIIKFDWRGADNSHWPHNTGPMLTYMASCGSTSCDQFDASNARWFKVYQVGRKSGSVQWVQQDLYDGGVDTVTIPRNLASGNYLIRHEIIALHLATQRGGAEFYPACAQLRIGGSQTGKSNDSELVSLPGAYSDDDPGIYDPDVYNTNVEYLFPGPPVAAFIAGSSSKPSSTSTISGLGTSTRVASSTQTATPSKSSGKVCKLKRSSLQVRVQRRHLSWIMPRITKIAFPWS